MWRVFMPTNLVDILNGDKFAATVLEKLILRARNKDGTAYHLGEPIFLRRGQCLCGRDELANCFGMKRNESLRMHRILEKLEKTHKQINKQKHRNCSIISILYYDQYTSTEQSIELSMNNQRTINEQSMNTNKIAKNEEIEKSATEVYIAGNGTQYKAFIEFFNRTIGANFRQTDKTKKQFNARIAEFSYEEIMAAVRNAASDNFLMGDNPGGKRYLTPEYILRPESINKWVNNVRVVKDNRISDKGRQVLETLKRMEEKGMIT